MQLLIIQPVLTSYRKDFFQGLTKNFDEVNIYANLETCNGFKTDIEGDFNKIHTPVIGKRNKMYYQVGIISAILKKKPDIIYLTADFRALHYYIILIIAKLRKIPVYSHGQGLYDKPEAGLIYKLLFKITISMSNKYICYTDSVKNSLLKIGINKEKLTVIDNTIVNECPVEFNEKNSLKNKILYIGRLRKGSNLQLLFKAMQILSKNGLDVELVIIGDGEDRKILENYSKAVHIKVNFLGAIYDDTTIAKYSKECKVGVYPGDAGLSLVHYMSLSLVPIIHNDLAKHMGPEPSYIIDGENGLFFKRNDEYTLADAIKKILEDDTLYRTIAEKSYETYKSLSTPTMAEKFLTIIRPFLSKEHV